MKQSRTKILRPLFLDYSEPWRLCIGSVTPSECIFKIFYLIWLKSGHRIAKVGSLIKLAINLPRSAAAVSWPLLVGTEKWQQNCQGRQFESQRHWCAENRP